MTAGSLVSGSSRSLSQQAKDYKTGSAAFRHRFVGCGSTGKDWLGGKVEGRPTESLLAARQAYQVSETGQSLKAAAKLAECLRGSESAGRAPSALSGRDSAGDGAQRGVARELTESRGGITWRAQERVELVRQDYGRRASRCCDWSTRGTDNPDSLEVVRPGQ
jgi:hypothetical protein